MTVAGDIAALKAAVAALQQRAGRDEAQIATVQQRCTRLEVALGDVKAQLAKVKKG